MDSVVVYAHAGNGGNGSVSFRREKFVPRGGPDGGDGGRGGHVILQGDADTDSLVHLYFVPHQSARPGGHGSGKKSHGRNGKDNIIKVPCGTEVWNTEDHKLVTDIVEHGQTVIIARGGEGGNGNCHWKTSTHQAPTEHTDGIPTEEISLRLELKIVADIGMVGFPNAGKSSLLTKISQAHPKIGAYPFTTLNPIIGTVIFPDYNRLTVADIPGLIKDAHLGSGLGHAFLRHIERSRFILYILDMAGVDTRNPYDDYIDLKNELELYDNSILERPSLVVANKMDLPDAAKNLSEFTKESGVDPIQISASTGDGVPELRDAIYETCIGPMPS